MEYINLPLIGWGLFVGLMVGFTGIGYGAIGTPGLILLFGTNPIIAVGSNIVAGAVGNIAGFFAHRKERQVCGTVCAWYLAGGIPAVFAGSWFAKSIARQIDYKLFIGIVLLLATAALFYRYAIRKAPKRVLSVTRKTGILSLFTGIAAGIIMGATSISGSLTLIALLIIVKLPSNVTVGTTITVNFVMLLVGALTHGMKGQVDWVMAGNLSAGSVAGVWLGTRYSARVPRVYLRWGIMITLFIAGIILIFS